MLMTLPIQEYRYFIFQCSQTRLNTLPRDNHLDEE